MDAYDQNPAAMQNQAPQPVPPQFVAPAAPMPVKKKRFALDTGDRLFALAALVLCVAVIAQGVFKDMFFGFSLIFTLIFITVSLYLTEKGRSPGVFASVCGGLALAGGAVYSLCTNGVIKLLLIPTLFILCVIWFAALAGIRIPEGDLGVFSVLFKNGIGDTLSNIPCAAASVFAGEEGQKKKGLKILIGVLVAVPPACVVAALLSGADAAFETMVSGLIDRIGEYLIYLALGLILSVLVITFAYSLKKEPSGKKEEKDHSRLDGVYACAFLGLLSVCYIAYLVSQLAYFFSAFKNLLPDGFSTAEYARRGFFELCAVAVINAVVIFAVIVLVKKKDGRLPAFVKALCVFISLFTLLLCATSISKMVLYINTYGMTVLRIGTSAFMLVIASVFVAVILRTFTPRAKILHTAVVAASFVLIVLGLVNINSLVAEYNYNAYVSGKTDKIDVFTIAESGAEGVPYLELLTHDEDQKTALTAAYELYEKRYDLYSYDYGTAFFVDAYRIKENNRFYNTLAAYNRANARAYEVMESFDFSGYDMDMIYEKYIAPHYNALYDDDAVVDRAEEKDEDIFDYDDYVTACNDLRVIVDVIRRGISEGKIKTGDEFELVAADKSIAQVAYNDALIPLIMSESERVSVGKFLAVTEKYYRIKVYADSIHFYDALDPECDRLVFLPNTDAPAESVQIAEDVVAYYAEEYFYDNWYILRFERSENVQ